MLTNLETLQNQLRLNNMTRITSNFAYLDIRDNLTSKYIEDKLSEQYGSIIRWAIVSTDNQRLKICFTYEKGEN